MALYDASPLKRKLLGLPDPGAAPDLPDLIGLGQQTMNAQMGSVTSDSGTNHQPRPTLGSRIRGALGQYGPGVAAGLVSSMDPNAGGLSAFASAAGRGFLGVEGARQQQAQEAQGAEDRMLRNDELRARIQALTTKTVNPNVILPRGGQLVSPDGRMLADNPEGPNAGMMPDWQKQGYPSFEAWRADRLRISRAGQGSEPKYTVKETPDGYTYIPNAPGAATLPVPGPHGGQLQPNVSPALADAHRANRQSLSVIDEAMAAIQANPKAVGGLVEHLPAFMQGVLDPKGQVARNPVSDVGSLEIKSRSGSAVNAGEMKRLGFVPDIRDPAPVVLDKLRRMRVYVQQQNQGMEEQFPGLRGSVARETPASGGGVSATERAALKAQGYSDAEIDAL